MLAFLSLVLLAKVGSSVAQLSSLRATLPGSLYVSVFLIKRCWLNTEPWCRHQCEKTNFFFFDSSNTRPLSIVLLPEENVNDSLRTGTLQFSDVAQYNPLQVIQNIQTPDAAEYDFTLGFLFFVHLCDKPHGLVGYSLQVAAEQAFEVFGFLPNGSGKALSLTRTVTTALPGATSCNPATATAIGAGV